MNITRSNYEIFVLDYLDGTLSEELRLSMQQFLQQNADLQQELNEFIPIIINPDETIQLPNKANLLYNLVGLDNYEEYAIDYIEQTLLPETQLAMNKFLETEPLLKNELNNFTLVTVPSDENIVYEHKEQLKKRAGKMGLLVSFFANPLLRYAAAVVALLVLWQPLSNVFDRHEIITALPHLKNNSLSSNNSKVVTPGSLPNRVSINNSISMHNRTIVDKGTNKPQNNQLIKPIKLATNTNLTSNRASYNSPSTYNVEVQKQPIAAQNTLIVEQTTVFRASTPTELASLDAKNVVDNTVVNYIIVPKSSPNNIYTDVKPNLFKRLDNRSNNAETLFAQNVLSRLPNSLLPQTISDGLNNRHQSVSVEIPIQPETHQRLKNFFGNK